ncbi:hypothetical protein ABPG72_021791 [Tetrahymena utriculariae]
MFLFLYIQIYLSTLLHDYPVRIFFHHPLFQPKRKFQEFKELRDGKKFENVDISSIKAESLANSSEYLIAQEWAQKQGLYDLNIIMKTKAYRNDNLQRIVKYQNPKLDQATMVTSYWEQQRIPITQTSSKNFNKFMIKIYNRHYKYPVRVQQLFRLYTTTVYGKLQLQDTMNKIKLYKYPNCIMKKKIPTHTSKNQQPAYTDTQKKYAEKQQLQKRRINNTYQLKQLNNNLVIQTQIIEIVKKWVAEQPMTIETILFQGNDQKYIIVFIDYDCLI